MLKHFSLNHISICKKHKPIVLFYSSTGAMAGAIAEAYYQKETLSDFEKKFIYLQIDPGYIERIKDFYNMLNNKKLIDTK